MLEIWWVVKCDAFGLLETRDSLSHLTQVVCTGVDIAQERTIDVVGCCMYDNSTNLNLYCSTAKEYGEEEDSSICHALSRYCHTDSSRLSTTAQAHHHRATITETMAVDAFDVWLHKGDRFCSVTHVFPSRSLTQELPLPK